MFLETPDTEYMEDILIRQILRNEPEFFSNNIDAQMAESILVQLSGATGWNRKTDFSFINFLLEKMPINEFSLFSVRPKKGITVLQGNNILHLYDIMYPIFKNTYFYGDLSSKANIYNHLFDVVFSNGFCAFNVNSKKTEIQFSKERLHYIEAFSDKFLYIQKNIEKLNPEFINDYSLIVKLFYNYNEHYLNELSSNNLFLDKEEQNILNSVLIKKEILEHFVKNNNNIISKYLAKKFQQFEHKIEFENIKFQKTLFNILSDSVSPSLNTTPRL